MTLSVVNGYLCYSSCDVAKAEQGKNPHPKTDAEKAAAGQKPDAAGNPAGRNATHKVRSSSFSHPAVVFGGSLGAKASNGSTSNNSASNNGTSGNGSSDSGAAPPSANAYASVDLLA